MADPIGIDKAAQTKGIPSGVASSPLKTPEHKPYVSDFTKMPEFTFQAVFVGALLGIIFGASSLYLVLKVGMTVSASIPVAVLSITLFRAFSKAFRMRPTTILENNIVQTTGSAGESIAFGVGVTMPALMLIGLDMDLTRVMVVSILGGFLGILMMIPLRRAFIVKLHGRSGEEGKLLYPEGTACAQVLISGEKGGTSGLTVFVGFVIAFAHKFISEGMNVLRTTVTRPLKDFSKVAQVSGEMASELLGVGYIIGFRTSSIMMAGAVLGSLVIAPTIYLFGANVPAPLQPSTKIIKDMTLDDIHKDYIRFIGAGCVAAAGIISMGRTLPLIVRSIGSGLGNLGGLGRGGATATVRRTEDDLSLRFVAAGCVFLLGLLAYFLMPEVGLFGGVMGALLVLLFGFLFVTVSSRLTGEIGSSSNPISGMTVATLLLTCLIFLALGMTGPRDALLALSIGGVVCIAASNGGTTSQDLKTGYLIGGTPRLQQLAIMVGTLTSALVIGFTLLLFNASGTIYSTRNLPDLNVKAYPNDKDEKETYEGKTYHVWRPTKEALEKEAGKGIEKNTKYLVDDNGRIRYYVDPAITGKITKRETYVPIELKGVDLKNHLREMKDRATVGDKVYLVWNHRQWKEGDEESDKPSHAYIEGFDQVPAGDYLVDDEGVVRYRIDSTKLRMKFGAPKTQVMGIIINGLLNQDLNWTMILIGAFIAVTLELCGVSSLAFAVGVYVPMQYSVPIFFGGIIRWAVDAYTRRTMPPPAEDTAAARAEAEVRLIAKTESSPSVLLASGYIAGGSMGGVVIAFFELIPVVKEKLDFSKVVESSFLDNNFVPLAIFSLLMGLLILVGMGLLFRSSDNGAA